MESPSSQLFKLLDYPRGDLKEGERRLKLLSSYGVKNLSFVSKGYRGVVFRGELSGKSVAVKLPRSDAGKEGIAEKECSVLKYLEECLGERNPAPRVYLCTPEFLVMEWIEGLPFAEALQVYGKRALVSALESCYLLDTCGVEHSEIKGEKHLIYDGERTRVIDFESARFKENPRNLLQFAGYHLLRRGELLKRLQVDEGVLRSLLTLYKENRDEAFPKILSLFDK